MRNGAVIANIPASDISTNEVVDLMSGTKAENTDSNNINEIHAVNMGNDNHKKASKANNKKPIFHVNGLLIPSWNTTIEIELFVGEILGIGGLQGQGQSELLRLLFGAIPHRTGSLILKGNEINISSPKDAVSKGFGFLSGDREAEGIFAPRSVKENLIAVPGGFSTEKEERNKPVTPQTIIDQLGIVLGSIKQSIKSLSGGNQQKVVIGRWLGVKPTVLLADDPTKGVDVQARHDVHSILRDLSKTGSAIIIASSDDHELVEVADRIIVMNEGRIVSELTGEDRTEQQIVAASLPTLKDKGLDDGKTVSLS
jgi:ribose transport system ATP-binding protein